MKVYTGVREKSLAQVPDDVRLAEEMGYDGVSFSEIALDPFLAATLGAEHSQRVMLGTSIALAFPRSPMTTAYMSWNLQVLSKGRFQLGLGSQVRGHNIRRFSVAWTPPGPRMREYVESLRAIWDCWQHGTPLNYQGQDYSFSLMTPEFSPGPIPYDPPQVFIAAVNPYMCRLAGELCDGVLLHGLATQKYVQEVILPNLEVGARKAGRSIKDVEVSGGGFIVVGDGEEELQRGFEAARQRISFYGSTQVYRSVLEVHGWGPIGDQLREMSFKGQWEQMPRLVTDEMVEAFSVMGAYDDIAGKLKQHYGGYASRISLPLPEGDGAMREKVRGVLRELQS